MNKVFTVEQLHPMKDGMTISRDARLGSENRVTFFSLGNKKRGRQLFHLSSSFSMLPV